MFVGPPIMSSSGAQQFESHRFEGIKILIRIRIILIQLILILLNTYTIRVQLRPSNNFDSAPPIFGGVYIKKGSA